METDLPTRTERTTDCENASFNQNLLIIASKVLPRPKAERGQTNTKRKRVPRPIDDKVGTVPELFVDAQQTYLCKLKDSGNSTGGRNETLGLLWEQRKSFISVYQ